MPLSIKKSKVRDRYSPVVPFTTNELKSTSTSTRKRCQGSLIQNHRTLDTRKRKSLYCKCCGVPFKPTNSNNISSRECKCKNKTVSVKSIKSSNSTTLCPSKKKSTNSKLVLSGKYVGNDCKLLSSPVVVISTNFRMLAESAAMRLRKGARIGETNRSIKESEPEDESSEESSSEFEDSSDEEVFVPSKTYPLRKKSKLSTPARNRRISSGSSDSSSESLPDLDFPIDRRWSVPSKDIFNDVKKVGAVTNGNSEARRTPSNLHGTMGSTQAKTARKPSDDRLPSRTTGIKPRSLRSTDGPSHDRSDLRVPEPSNKSLGPPQISTKPRLSTSHSSPDRNSVDRKASSSTYGKEKSYSLRYLEKKDGTLSTNAESNLVEDQNNEATVDLKSFKTARSRGRPRKVPKVESEEDPLAGTSKGSSSTPLTRSQRRAAQSEPHQVSSPKFRKVPRQELDMSSITITNVRSIAEMEISTFRPQTSVSMKVSRDAVALRARQSKIMAKSRVWQCNRNNSTWNNFHESKKVDIIPAVTESLPVSTSTNNSQARSMLTLMRNNNANKNQLQFLHPRPTTVKPVEYSSPPLVKKPAYPKAKCDLCNMTFTRRFSLTKHYMTIQHRKMVQQASKSSSEELRALAKSVPVLVRQPRGINNSMKSTNTATTMKSRVPPPSKKQEILFVEENGHKSDSGDFDESNNMDESSDTSQTISPDPEVNGSTSEGNYLNVDPPAVQEWLSGKALGRNDFLCNICEERFTKKKEFSAHLWSHREDADLNCKDCGIHFSESDAYNHHIDNAHLIDTKFSCIFCPSKFNREDYLEKHMSSHKRDRNEKFICSVCDKRFSAHELLLRHFDSKHLQLGKPRVQLTCDSPEDLRSFPKIPEFIVFDNENDEDNDDTPTSCDEIDPEYRDQMPDIDLEMEGIIIGRKTGDDNGASENDPIPMISPEDYSRELPVEIFNRYQVFGNSKKKNSAIATKLLGCGYKSRLPITFTPQYRNNLMCIDCGKTFQNRKTLLKHVEYFNQAERYTCQVCKMRFKFKHLLSRHQLRHLPQKDLMKPHHAGLRKASFLKHRKLVARKLPRLLPILPNNHELDVNGPEDSADSGEIGESDPLEFDTPTLEENRNEVSHKMTSETVGDIIYNLFACDICTETFTEKQTLAVHTWFHQKENVYSCPDCDARCERKSDLDLHYKCHETAQPFFLCYVCFKPFRWKKDMVRHVRKKHSAERTYRCIYCPERFRKNEELSRHISKRHPEHRSFPCQYCGRRYAQKRYLLVHIQTQHGIEPVPENLHPISMKCEDEEDEVEDDEDLFLQTDHEDDQL